MRPTFQVLPVVALTLAAVCCSRPEAAAPPETAAAASNQPTQRATAAPIEVNEFYDDLEPYGDWVEMPDYGWSFAPRVDDDWRPYTRGQWEYTDDGWYWDSDEDFGWATYHYGRWVDDRRYGWVWVPGDEWAPAWVSWRQGDGYTGWAPLPPRARWRSNGLELGGLEIDAYIGVGDYNFVEDRHFVDRGVYQRLQPSTVNLTIINRTSNVTNYTTVNNRVFNRGVAVGDVERSVGRKVTPLRTVDRDRRDDRARARSGEVAVFRPKVKMASDRKPSRGSSVVKGEAPPPSVAERGKRREAGRSRMGRENDVSARDAAQQRRDASRPDVGRPAGQTPPATAPRQELPRERSSREANAQRARVQEQERIEGEKRKADERQRVEAQAEQTRRDQQQAERGRQGRRVPPQTGDRGRGTRGPDVGKPTPEPAATRPPETPRSDSRGQERAAQRERDQAAQEAARQQQAAQEQQRVERERARAADQQQRGQPQRDRQPPQDAGRGKRQETPPPQAEKPKQDPQEKKGPPPGQGRDKGKKEPKPTPAPGR